jgi:uncharacterized lipoprotein YddW (UPF0748 family)
MQGFRQAAMGVAVCILAAGGWVRAGQGDIPAPAMEFRGAWLHWQDYASPAAVRRTVARAQQIGLNVLLPLANYPDHLMYRSDLLPLNRNVAAGFDPLPALVQAAHGAGIEVHPYFVLCNAGLTKIARHRPDWWVQDAEGRSDPDWLDPAHPEVRDFLTALVTDVVRCGVDGVHFDYIRYSEKSRYCYCPRCRREFQAAYGVDPVDFVRPRPGGRGLYLLRTPYQESQGAYLFREIQKFVTAAGFSPPLIRPGSIDSLPAASVLVAGNLYRQGTPAGLIPALLRFARRGGGVILLDGPEVLRRSPPLAEAVGLGSPTFFDTRTVILWPVTPHPITAGVTPTHFQARGNPCREAPTSQVLVRFEEGWPAVTWKSYGRGHFVVFNYHCYQGESGENEEVLKLFANAVGWLGAQNGAVNTTALRAADGNGRSKRQAWDEWRCQQVTGLVRQMSAALRAAHPGLLVSAAGGTREEDKRTLFRDGKAWLEEGLVDYLCPMLYTEDTALFQQRLDRELASLPEELRRRLYPGLGAYKLVHRAPRLVEQVEVVRRKGLQGVCFFSFEYLTDEMVRLLREGPFREPALPPR